MKWVLSSKIQKAVVVGANLAYVGSITIDEDLLDRAGLWPGEKVLVVSNSSGSRLETYVIKGERDSGAIYMNGAASLLIKEGEEIIIMGFVLSDKPVRAKNILVDKRNKFVRYVEEKERQILET
jgi:aspartate 1-decarboxylase